MLVGLHKILNRERLPESEAGGVDGVERSGTEPYGSYLRTCHPILHRKAGSKFELNPKS